MEKINMKVLVLNCGSSSLKFQMLDMSDESVIAKGQVERIGLPGTKIQYIRTKDKAIYGTGINAKDHKGITSENINTGYFTLINNGVPAMVLCDNNDDIGVNIAAENLRKDFIKVCGNNDKKVKSLVDKIHDSGITKKDKDELVKLTKEKFKAITKNLLYCNVCLDEPCKDLEEIIKKRA